MIIHSPIISGSLTFADGGALALPNPTQLSGSFSGSAQFSEITSHIVPDAANTYDLGSEANYFRDLYISTGSLKGIGNGTVSFKLGGKSTGGLKVTDANDDPVEIEAKEITLKDTSGNGNNIKLKVQNGALKSTKVSNTDVEDEAAEPQTLQSNISGSLIVTGSTSLENTTIAGTVDATGLASLDGGINVADNLTVDASGNTVVGGTLDSTGLASLDGGVDVDGAFTVADGTGNVSTTGTLGVTGTSTLGVINASGLLSADAGIDVDGAFTVADGTGNVSTSGTLGAGNTTIAGTVDASGLASLDGGIDVDGAFTVANTSGNVSTTGTLASGQQTVTGHILPGAHNTYDLGSTTLFWRDLYLSSGSLYINGQQVLSTDGTDLTVQTDAGESLKLLETGADTITLQTENGDITLTNGSGTGNIELDAPIQITAGNNILSSDGNAIAFANDISAGSNRISANNIGNLLGTSTITGSFVGDGSGLTGLATILTIDDASTTQNVDLIADDLQFLGTTNEIETAVTKDSTDVKVTIGLPSDVTIGNDLTVTNDLGVSGNAVITGNLTVSGTTTSVNSNTVNIGDNQIVLNSDETGTPTQNGGIAIERGSSTNASIIWNETNDYWMSGLLGAEERIVVGVGNTDITTLGTIGTGVWNGTAITHDYIGLDAIDGTNISDDSIDSEHLVDLGIDTAHLAADSVTGAKIADNSINSEHYVDGSIDNVHLAADSVNGAKIADNAIDSEHYTDGSIDTEHLAADCINSTKIADGNVNNEHIGANAVDGTKIADDSIDSEHYVDGSIDTAHIGDLQVTNGKIAADAIDGAKIADNAINSEHYTDASIDRAHLADDVINSDKIDDNAINSEHYVDGSIDNVHLAGGIAASKITEISGLTEAEGSQLEKIGSNVISATQWGYLANSNQNVKTDSTVNFGSITSSGLLAVNGTGTSVFSSHLKSHCLGVGVNPSGTSGEIHAGADIVAYSSSDKRLKENIKPIDNPLGKLHEITGVTFDWIENSEVHSHKGNDIGVIAQEIEAVLPELVTTRENGYKAVKYDKIVALLIEAVKHQQSEILELKNKIG